MECAPRDVIGVIAGFLTLEERFLLGGVCRVIRSALGPRRAPRRLTIYAAKHSHWELLHWARGRGFPLHQGAVNEVVRAGRLDLLRQLPGKAVGKVMTLYAAAHYGNFPIVQWLIERFPRVGKNATGVLEYAAHHEEIFRWLHGRDIGVVTELTYYAAARAGRIDILRLLTDTAQGEEDLFSGNDYVLHITSTCAVRGGHLPLLQWLHEEDYPLAPDLCDQAVVQDRLDILRWLMEHTLGWSRKLLCCRAAYTGRVEILRWLLSEGQRVKRSVVNNAVRGGHMATVRYFIEQGHTIERDGEAIVGAVINGDLDSLRWFLEMGFPFDAEQIMAALHHYGPADDAHTLSVVQWLYSEGRLSRQDLANWKWAFDRPETLHWLLSEGLAPEAEQRIAEFERRATQNEEQGIIRRTWCKIE